jgi:hypothetical protein
MCTVCGARMHAGGAAFTPQPPHQTTTDRCAISRGRRLLVIHSGAIAFSAACRTPVRIAVSGQLRPSRTTSAPRCGGYAGAGPSTPGDLVSGTHDNSPATPLGIDEVAPWVL